MNNNTKNMTPTVSIADPDHPTTVIWRLVSKAGQGCFIPQDIRDSLDSSFTGPSHYVKDDSVLEVIPIVIDAMGVIQPQLE